MSILRTRVVKQVHDVVLTLRFTVGTVIAVPLATLAAYMGGLDYNTRLDSYHTKLKLKQESLAVTPYSKKGHHVRHISR